MIIKNRTYRNYLYVLRAIQAKGYSKEEACKLADNVFAQMTECMTAQRLIDKILSKEDFEKEYEGRKVPVRAGSQSAGN